MADHAHTMIPSVVSDADVAARAAWYLSVCDLSRLDGDQFLGVFVTTELDLRVASDSAWSAAGRGDDIQIAAFPYPAEELFRIGVNARDRLLPKLELSQLGENTENAGQLGYW